MPKARVSEEVQILRFFEEAPLDKAEMLFNIVKEKMHNRSAKNVVVHEGAAKKRERLPVASEGAGKDDRAQSL